MCSVEIFWCNGGGGGGAVMVLMILMKAPYKTNKNIKHN